MVLFRKFLSRNDSKWGTRFFQLDLFRIKEKTYKKAKERGYPIQKAEEIGYRIREVWYLVIGSIFVVLSLLEFFGIICFGQ
jgi:hypothetical protein